MAQRLIERRIEIQYDPKPSSSCYIPDNRFERYQVEQKMRPDLLKKLSRSDQVNSSRVSEKRESFQNSMPSQ
jgi:hypothetical protein